MGRPRKTNGYVKITSHAPKKVGRPCKKRRGPLAQLTTASEIPNYLEVANIGRLVLSDEIDRI